MNVKRILSLVCLVIASAAMCVSAQPGGGGGMGGGMGGGQRGGGGGMGGGRPPMDPNSAPKDFVESAGLFYIDVAEIVDKCKIKDESVVAQITQIVIEYERTYNNIMMENFDQIDSLRSMQEKPVTLNMSDLSKSSVKNPMQIVQKLKEKTIPMHLTLKEQIDVILDKKSKKRWESYYTELCEEKSFSIKAPRGRGEGGSGSRPERGGGMGMDSGGGFSSDSDFSF